jgi:hypothetical protein
MNCPKCGSDVDHKATSAKRSMMPRGSDVSSIVVWKCKRSHTSNEDTLQCLRNQLAAAVSRAEAAERERDIALSRVQYLYKLCKRILWLAERSDIKHSRATLHCTCMAIEMRKANGDTK